MVRSSQGGWMAMSMPLAFLTNFPLLLPPIRIVPAVGRARILAALHLVDRKRFLVRPGMSRLAVQALEGLVTSFASCLRRSVETARLVHKLSRNKRRVAQPRKGLWCANPTIRRHLTSESFLQTAI